MKIGSLCSGAGMLDLAAERVFGAETAWHCEIDAAASKVLAARWDVPNYHDLTATDWSTVEPVDVVAAGWPCQPWSPAGQMKGAADERAIWPEIARAVRELRPRYVFLENVSAVVVLGELARAAGDLAEAGYDAQWTCLSAAGVGAPHKRERFFILAADTNDPRWVQQRRTVSVPPEQPASEYFGYFADEAVMLPTPRTTDANGPGRHGEGGMDLRTAVTLLPTPSCADASGGGVSAASYQSHTDDKRRAVQKLRDTVKTCETQWGKYEPAIRRWEQLTRPAPPPTEPNSKGNPRLSARFAEWMMGLPAGWVTDVDLPRSAQLKILGNGVVPTQAEAALRYLLSVAEVAA